MNEELEFDFGDSTQENLRVPTTFNPNPIENPTINFYTEGEEIIRISKDGFYYKGRLVENDKEIYQKFLDFLNTHSVEPIEDDKIELNTIEEYQNLVQLQRQALRFYADKDNYVVNKPVNNVLFSNIEMDGGVQARFAFEQTEKILETNENMMKEYDRISLEMLDSEKNNDEGQGFINKINGLLND